MQLESRLTTLEIIRCCLVREMVAVSVCVCVLIRCAKGTRVSNWLLLLLLYVGSTVGWPLALLPA